MNSQSSLEPFPEPTGHEAATPTRPPLEARLVQAGKLSMSQLAQAHRDRLESGAPLLDIIVKRGWITAEDIAEVGGEHAVAVGPQGAVEVEAELVPPPARSSAPEGEAEETEPDPGPEPAPAARVLVGIRLANGDLVAAGHAADADNAATLGQAVVAELTQANSADWPFFDGRFIKPEAIVSVDLVVDD